MSSRKIYFLIYILVVLLLTFGCNIGSTDHNEGKANTIDSKDQKELMDEYSGNTISPTVPLHYKDKLLNIIEDMKEMDPGIEPWRIVYYYEDKIILYNYAHIIACDLSNDNNGIISIIELKDLNVGHFQGEWPIRIYPSPDARSCILGTDTKLSPTSDKGLYLCDLVEGSVTELAKNYNIGEKKIKWYRTKDQMSWYVTVEGSEDVIIGDVNHIQSCTALPENLTEIPVNYSFISSIKDTGYNYHDWWKIDDKTFLGAPYKKGVSVTDNKDSDLTFQVDSTKVNLNKSGSYTVTYSAKDSSGNKAVKTATITVIPFVVSDEMLYEKVDKILDKIVDEGMTKREIAYEIYLWVKGHVAYTGSSDKSDWKKGAYLGIEKGLGDCFTYYAVSEALLTRAGIDNMRVTRVGGRTQHFWNLIDCGDGWYHFDTCPNKDKIDTFMLTDAQVEEYTKKRGNNYYNFDKSLYPRTPEN